MQRTACDCKYDVCGFDPKNVALSSATQWRRDRFNTIYLIVGQKDDLEKEVLG